MRNLKCQNCNDHFKPKGDEVKCYSCRDEVTQLDVLDSGTILVMGYENGKDKRWEVEQEDMIRLLIEVSNR